MLPAVSPVPGVLSDYHCVIGDIETYHPVGGDRVVYPLNLGLHLLLYAQALPGNGFQFPGRQFAGAGN